MERQIEFKEEVLLVGFTHIIKAYKFTNGKIMRRKEYNENVWENSGYCKEDFYFRPCIGNDFPIKTQQQIVKTVKEAKEFQTNQRLKLIRKKQEEIKQIKKEITSA